MNHMGSNIDRTRTQLCWALYLIAFEFVSCWKQRSNKQIHKKIRLKKFSLSRWKPKLVHWSVALNFMFPNNGMLKTIWIQFGPVPGFDGHLMVINNFSRYTNNYEIILLHSETIWCICLTRWDLNMLKIH